MLTSQSVISPGLEDGVDQNDAENEGRGSANYLDLSISREPPINHSSVSIQTEDGDNNCDNKDDESENSQHHGCF